MKTTGFLLVCAAAISSWTHAAEQWRQYGGDCLHNPVARSGVAPPLVQPRWTALPEFELTAASTPVVFDGTVYVYGLAYDWSTSYMATYSVADGSPGWRTPIDAGVQDSWSSPAIDPASRSVLIGSGRKVFALDADTGESNWTTDLGTDIFNSSVTIAEGRAFISNSTVIATSSGGDQGKLFALNLGATSDELGTILWSAPLGVTSGCTPAYYARAGGAAGFVIVADADGWIRALNAETGGEEWSYRVPDPNNYQFPPAWKWVPGGTFWGAVSIEGDSAYVASYGFYGGEDNSFLYRLNALTGDFVWRTPSERSSSVPVIVGDTVLLCGGLHMYGVPKIEAFAKDTGAKLWEFTDAGGRDHTPAVVNGVCYVGTAPGFGGFYYQTLYALDLSLTPNDAEFVMSSHDGAGGTPAYADDNIYSVGADGLQAFGEAPPEHAWPVDGDANLDCLVNILDLIFVRNRLNSDPASGDNWQADVNDDGSINILDMIFVRNALNTRCPE